MHLVRGYFALFAFFAVKSLAVKSPAGKSLPHIYRLENSTFASASVGTPLQRAGR